MPKLIALKSFSYATRRLLPDDEFDAKPMHARVLVVTGKAREADDEEKSPKKAKPAKAKVKTSDKPEPKPEAKQESKPEPRQESKPEGRVGAMRQGEFRPAIRKPAGDDD